MTPFSLIRPLNVNGVVLETSALYRENLADCFKRGELRLVYDQPKFSRTYSMGDLRYPVIGYTGNRGLVGLSFRQAQISDNHAYHDENEMAFRFQNAVAFADGAFALFRPINGSFVMVKGEKSLENTAIGINPDYSGRFKALSTLFGPAIVPDLPTYP